MEEDLDALSPRSDATLRLVSEDPEDSRNLREKLREELDSINSAGTFASFTSLDVDPDFVDPKIEIENVGVINTPLVPEDVPKLTGAAHPSPFGQGDQTIVDPSVRSSWELDANQFRITNPLWPIFMDKLLGMVQLVLGVDPIYKIKAELYKMLLYGKGAHFKPHQDSEKGRNMFGTLVICLPAPHRGGDVIAELGEQKRIFRTSECSKSCLFWYSDVQHEVTEVTAGHRWVLTYNLIRPEFARLNSFRHEYPLLKRTLGSWRKACDREDFWKKEHFVYVLQHKYSQANLAFDKLKGKDLAQARALQDHCEAPGFCVFIANISEMKYGGASEHPVRGDPRRISFHRIIDIVDTEVRLTRVVDFAGRAVAGNITVATDKSDRLLKRGKLGRGDPDAAEFTPYTGNEGRDATHWYRQAAIVLMPWEHVPRFLSENLFSVPWGGWNSDGNEPFRFKLEDTIEFLLSELHKQPDRALIREAVENFCSQYVEKRISRKPSTWGEAPYADTLLQAAIKCDNPRIFEIASKGLKNGELSDFAFKALSSWLFEKGFPYLEPSLSRHVALHPSIHQVYHLCSGIMRPTEAFYEERKRKSEESGFSAWISAKLSEAMSRSSDVNAEDGEALANILTFADDRDSVMPSVMDAVQRNIPNSSFALGFLQQMERAMHFESSRLPEQMARRIYEEVAAQCIQHLDLRSAEQKSGNAVPATAGKRSMHFPSRWPTPEIECRKPAVDGLELKNMFEVLHRIIHADSLVDKLFEKIQDEAKRVDVDLFPEQMTSFLFYVGNDLESLGIERVRPLYRNVLESYLMQGIGKAYKEPNWSRPGIDCSCGTCYCRAVNQFLHDPKRTHVDLKLKLSAHRYLKQKLESRPAMELESGGGPPPATLHIAKLPDEQYHEAQRLKRRHKEYDEQVAMLEDVMDLRKVLGNKYNYLVKKRALWWAEPKPSGT
ncbi:hypothetical protein IWZ01DRAFT_223056 [Phyllosticta capitalensis]